MVNVANDSMHAFGISRNAEGKQNIQRSILLLGTFFSAYVARQGWMSASRWSDDACATSPDVDGVPPWTSLSIVLFVSVTALAIKDDPAIEEQMKQTVHSKTDGKYIFHKLLQVVINAIF